MPKQAFETIFGTPLKVIGVSIVLVANALIWYFYYFSFMLDVINTAGFSDPESLTIWGIGFLALALSALFSFTLLNRVKSRNTFLFYWLSAGVILSLMPLAIDITQFYSMIVFSLLGSTYFGLGMPICFGYFATVTEAKNRSRMSGITFLCVFAGFFFLSVLNINDIAFNSLILAVWKFGGLAALLLIKPKEEKICQGYGESYISILKNRPFLLYFIPWLMFSVVNYLAIPIISESFTEIFGDYTFVSVVENALSAVFAVVFGFLGDYVGRKRLTVAGFVLLGVGYASLGLFSESLAGCWLYVIVDGIAWGAFYTIFLMTLWGDLADGRNSEKYYALGSLPYLFSNFMRIYFGASVSSFVAEEAVFSFASLFLFLAVLPLIYAPETLPEKIVKERELRTYLEKAQKEAEKTQKKKNETPEKGNMAVNIEFEACDGISNEPEKQY
jgi:MFS family permease